MGHRSGWWSAFSVATTLMLAACWLICAMPVWLGWLDSSVSRVVFFIPIAGLGVPFFIGWLTARKTHQLDPSASGSGVFLAVLGFCMGLGLQDAVLDRAPAAFLVMLGVGGARAGGRPERARGPRRGHGRGPGRTRPRPLPAPGPDRAPSQAPDRATPVASARERHRPRSIRASSARGIPARRPAHSNEVSQR